MLRVIVVVRGRYIRWGALRWMVTRLVSKVRYLSYGIRMYRLYKQRREEYEAQQKNGLLVTNEKSWFNKHNYNNNYRKYSKKSWLNNNSTTKHKKSLKSQNKPWLGFKPKKRNKR